MITGGIIETQNKRGEQFTLERTKSG